ncbi:Uncharacterised protein [uncultured archaeon]|nr:Uncharacterised protein [uncultured archaeon]
MVAFVMLGWLLAMTTEYVPFAYPPLESETVTLHSQRIPRARLKSSEETLTVVSQMAPIAQGMSDAS